MEIILLAAVVGAILGLIWARNNSRRRYRTDCRQRRRLSQQKAYWLIPLGNTPSETPPTGSLQETPIEPTYSSEQRGTTIGAATGLLIGETLTAVAEISEHTAVPIQQALCDELEDPTPRRATEVPIPTNTGTTNLYGLPEPNRFRTKRSSLMIWKSGATWMIGIDLKGTTATSDDIRQDGDLLKRSINHGRFLLTSLTSPILAHGEQFIPSAPEMPVALFRCTEQSEGEEAIAVSGINVKGMFIAVVPNSWTRDEDLCSKPPVTPEPTSIPGYQAHYFGISSERTAVIAFIDSAGVRVVLSHDCHEFELVGDTLASFDESVYVGDFPLISASRNSDWGAVHRIDLLSTANDSKVKTFSPESARLAQSFGEDLISGKYLVELVNSTGTVLWSTSFVYIHSLLAIDIQYPEIFPSEAGHKPVQLSFHLRSHALVEPIEPETECDIKHLDQLVQVIIPNLPNADATQWKVTPDEQSFTVFLDRIWWSLGITRESAHDWSDSRLKIPRKDFSATSDATIFIHLPRIRWASSVMLGLGEMKKAYPVRVADRTVAIPLREFTDALELSDLGEHSMVVWIQRPHCLLTSVLGSVEVFGKCKLCAFTTSVKQEMTQHWVTAHGTNIFSIANDMQLQHLLKRLPSAVFECEGCSARIVSRDPDDPDSHAQLHSARSCPELHRTGKVPTVRVLSRKADLIKAAKSGLICIECGAVYDAEDPAIMGDHYAQMHSHKVLSLVK